MLVLCLKLIELPTGDHDQLLEKLCLELGAEKTEPRELIRLCRKFIDMHLAHETVYHEAANHLLHRWEAALPV